MAKPNPKLIKTVVKAGRRGDRLQTVRDRSEDADKRLETVPNSGGEWKPEHVKSIQAMQAVPGWTGETPWKPKHQLEINAAGGIYSRDRRRLQVAGNVFIGAVKEDRNVEVTGDSELKVDGNATFSVKGTNRLRVAGDADWHAHDRMTLGTGEVSRLWKGGILRMIGMEGIICGGAFLKTFTGTSATMAPIASGDVYGGSNRVAGLRTRMHSHMGYRSSEICMWTCGTFIRSCGTLIEPIPGTPAQDPRRNMLKKAGRIGLGLCPVADILFGLLSAPVTIALAIRNFVKRNKKPQPPKGPPRVFNRTALVTNQSRLSDLVM